MGAAQYDGRPSPIFAARLDHAVELYRAGVAPRLVVTGGKADGDRTTEAATARAYAIARGVPADAILVEDRSRTTLESIRAVGDILRDHGLADASSCPTDRTCCASCGWPPTTASRPGARRPRTSPIEGDPRRAWTPRSTSSAPSPSTSWSVGAP